MGYATEQGDDIGAAAKPEPEPAVPDPLADEPPLRQLPRLALDAELIGKLERWAGQFDELDEDRYTAAAFIEWVRLEHLPAPPAKAVTSYGVSYPVIGEGRLAAI